MSKEKRIHIVKSIIKHALLLCVGFFWIYPFLWMISASFKGQNEFFQNRLGLIPLVPTIDNFIRIWQKADFGTYFINTIIVTVFSVIIVLIMTMTAGYAMGTLQICWKKYLYGGIFGKHCNSTGKYNHSNL